MSATLPTMPPRARKTTPPPATEQPDLLANLKASLEDADPATRSAAGRALREATKMTLSERGKVAAAAQSPEMKSKAGQAGAAKLHSLPSIITRLENRAWKDDVTEEERIETAAALRALARRLANGVRPE